MRRSVRTALIATSAAVVAATSLFAVTLNMPANADDSAGEVSPNVAQSIPLDLIYGAVGRVPALEAPNVLEVPGWGSFNLGNAAQGLSSGTLQAQWALASLVFALSDADLRVKQEFPDANVQLADPNDPLFSNWKFENGSKTVESGGRNSTSSPESGTTYNISQSGDGTITADYSAKATVQGTQTTVFGNYTFESLGIGQSQGFGSIGVNSSVSLWPEGPDLRLNGYANVFGGDAFSVSLGSTSYGIGITGATKDGNHVGVSAAVGPRGELLGMSIGGSFAVPNFPEPVQFRVDLNNSGGNFSASPVPGVTVTNNTNGTFRLDVSVNTFYPWFTKVVSGD